jgi:hypothetical protein
MVIAQFSHFWELAVTAYLSTNAAEARPTAELLNPPLRVAHLEEMLDGSWRNSCAISNGR